MSRSIITDVKKSNRVIASCLTHGHIKIAKKMVDNLARKHKKYHDIDWVMGNYPALWSAIKEKVNQQG